MTVNQWITENYEDILQWAKNAAQQHSDFDDIAHYAITTFLEHDKAQALVDAGQARWFIVRIMLNSSRSKKSHYYRNYRQTHQELTSKQEQDTYIEYDHDVDRLTEWIHGILEDMKHGDAAEWFNATIFEQLIRQPKLNFSKLARETGIPRTSIAHAYKETIEYVKTKLIEYGDIDTDIRLILLDYFDNTDGLV